MARTSGKHFQRHAIPPLASSPPLPYPTLQHHSYSSFLTFSTGFLTCEGLSFFNFGFNGFNFGFNTNRTGVPSGGIFWVLAAKRSPSLESLRRALRRKS